MKQNMSSLTLSALFAAGLLTLSACKKESSPSAPAIDTKAVEKSADDAADAMEDAADDAVEAVDDAAKNLPPVNEPAP